MIPETVHDWLEENDFGRVVSTARVTGGCINNGLRLHTSDGGAFFLKTNTNAPADMFAREAEGLLALNVEGGPRIPKVYFYGEDFILMEDLTPAPRQAGYWEALGKQLAVLHSHTAESFGFVHDNYAGSTPQPNPWTGNGYQFFAEHRLNFQARLAVDKGLLSGREADLVSRLALKLPELVPEQPPSLIHGDLWGGNAISGPSGEPALIDPAAHYGWAEAELGMTMLFGSFGGDFYRAYNQVNPLENGWRSRMDIYYLYHLINHLNLFGRGYYGQVMDVVRRYVS